MTIYDEMQGLASELLAEFKQGTITYIQITPGNGPVDDPGSPTETAFVMTGGTAKGASFKYISQGLATSSDKEVVAPVDARYIPDKKGFVDIDGTRYKVTEVEPRPSAGTPVVYIILATKNS